MLQSGGYDAHWQPVLTDWINAILQAPLTAQGFSLRQLTAKNKQVEMEFYLPVAGPLKADALDALIRQYDPLSAGCPPLNFRQVQGMLKGFIDWSSVTKDGTTCWITNQTGWARTAQPIPSRRWRPPCKCIATICNISSIPSALHRYLRHRIADYRYDDHFGGVIYLFLRGVDAADPRSGIFSTRPDAELINKMDNLFAANTEEMA